MGRNLSTLISGGILLLIAPLIIQFIWTAITYEDIEAFNILVQEENDIALILIAIGSFFLGRRLLYNWLSKRITADIPDSDLLLEDGEIIGFYLILLAILMEVFNLIIFYTNKIWDIGIILEMLINVPLDIFAAFLLGRLFCMFAFPKVNS
jgi:hypothetical protein